MECVGARTVMILLFLAAFDFFTLVVVLYCGGLPRVKSSSCLASISRVSILDIACDSLLLDMHARGAVEAQATTFSLPEKSGRVKRFFILVLWP